MKALLLLQLLGITTALGYRAFRRSDDSLSEAQIIAKASNDFGFAFFRELSDSHNAFISPISISMLMGLLYNGAKNTSAEEIRSVMKYPYSVHRGFKEILDVIKPADGLKTSKSDYKLEMANAIIVDSIFNILSSYKEESRKYYEAAVESISFTLHPQEAVDSVNGWVAWKTKNKIMKMLEEPLEPLTRLFLMNAVYFKGTWKSKFDQRFTMPDTFYNEGLVPKTVPMMRKKEKLRYGFDTRLQTHALELPYIGNDIKMLVLLPEKRDGLGQIEPQLSNDLLREISSTLREVAVQVTLPRFSLTEDYDLIPILKMMGIRSIFDSDTADLTGISSKQGLYVTKAVHKCSVEVNEEGSEAAAITGVSAGVRTGGPLVPQFNADHPFIFFIKDTRTDLTLFIGRVTKL